MKVIVSWSYQNAVTYAVFRGWARQSVRIVVEPDRLRGFGPNTEVYFLGPKDLYKFRLWVEFSSRIRYMELVHGATVVNDDTDHWVSEES